MMALPAVDLREGKCVQLVGGDYDRERVRIDDPLSQARAFRDMGFSWLHVVDLDAATGRGENLGWIERLIRESGLRVQVGGGVRTLERAAHLFDVGAERVIVGTRAIEDTAFREAVVNAFPGKVLIAADVREREVVTRGWAARTGLRITDLAKELDPLPIGGILVTAVHLEGALGGADAELCRELAQVTRVPIFASGGVTTLDDLARIRDAGGAGAVIGMALYTGTLDGHAVAREYGQ
ncbi:1-(5-phosphoribosyl)-5-[(5-phosphoribosylamino)methylideneamino]imidazole-4-carboxamide isomerase [Pendulispora rubella]|uniref:1-(5-phosphoribosyl)-5-[(5-phosphoribosylamino)methylideneamino] imidazole-4-carboxamide isomerase n=1 Tax=Pendulispora rubella TaxID=2741070 RepID=A0ABZ2KRV6_9BACT